MSCFGLWVVSDFLLSSCFFLFVFWCCRWCVLLASCVLSGFFQSFWVALCVFRFLFSGVLVVCFVCSGLLFSFFLAFFHARVPVFVLALSSFLFCALSSSLFSCALLVSVSRGRSSFCVLLLSLVYGCLGFCGFWLLLGVVSGLLLFGSCFSSPLAAWLGVWGCWRSAVYFWGSGPCCVVGFR